MEKMMTKLAIVRAGHDKNQVYLIAKEDDKYVYLVNGKTKTMSQPKRKSRKHVQIVKNIPEEVLQVLEKEEQDTNHQVHKALKIYERYIHINETRICNH